MGEDEETWNPPPGAAILAGGTTPPQEQVYHAPSSGLSHSPSSSSQGFPLNHHPPKEDYHNSVYNRYSASKVGYYIPTHSNHIQRPVPMDHQRVPTDQTQAPHRVSLDPHLAQISPQHQHSAYRNPHDPHFADTATRLNSSGWPVPEPRKTPDFSKYMRRPGDKAEAEGRIGASAGHGQHYQASPYQQQSSYRNHQPQHVHHHHKLPPTASAFHQQRQQQQYQQQLHDRAHQQYMPSTSGMYD